jgi:hypothetical protein
VRGGGARKSPELDPGRDDDLAIAEDADWVLQSSAMARGFMSFFGKAPENGVIRVFVETVAGRKVQFTNKLADDNTFRTEDQSFFCCPTTDSLEEKLLYTSKMEVCSN